MASFSGRLSLTRKVLIMDRAKFDTTAPEDEALATTPKNPSREFKKKSVRASGRSGKGVVRSRVRSTRKRG